MQGRHRAALRAKSAGAVATLALLLVAAGCVSDSPTPEPAEEPLWFVALDGRWSFDPRAADSILTGADVRTRERGSVATGHGILQGLPDAIPRSVDFVALDSAATHMLGGMSAAGADLAPPRTGELYVTRAVATASGLKIDDPVRIASQAWPRPHVAAHLEMDRTSPCAEDEDALLCFLETHTEGLTRLRLRVGESARDLAFLPDLVELGPDQTPAWWNGTFRSPSGITQPFEAYADRTGTVTPAVVADDVETGDWVIEYRLEANGQLVPVGTAGVVRIRQPSYLWFDDRFGTETTLAGQTLAIVRAARATSLDLRIAAIVDDIGAARFTNAGVFLSWDDAVHLAGMPPGEVDALLIRGRPDLDAVWAGHQPQVLAGAAAALRPRAIPWKSTGPETFEDAGGALLFRAPLGVALDALPRIDGAREPVLALAARAPIGERTQVGRAFAPDDSLLLAHASAAPRTPPWTLAPGGSFTDMDDALSRMTVSRVVILTSADLALPRDASTLIGTPPWARTGVTGGSVIGGPSRALWTTGPFLASASEPMGLLVVLPLDESADRGSVREAATRAFAPHGLALERRAWATKG